MLGGNLSSLWYGDVSVMAGMEDNHTISDELEIRQNLTTDCGVSCLSAFEKKNPIDILWGNIVSTLEPLFLTGSSSFL